MVGFINEGRVVKHRGGIENDVDPMTSENIEGVGTIGSHVVSPLTVFTIKTSAGLLKGATAVILQQVTGKNVVAGPLADLTNLPFCC